MRSNPYCLDECEYGTEDMCSVKGCRADAADRLDMTCEDDDSDILADFDRTESELSSFPG